jgi:hypothetical protein
LQTTIASLDSRRPPTWTSTGSCGVLDQPNHDDQHSSCAGPCGWPAAVAGGRWLDLASLSTWQHQEHSWVLSRAPSSFSNTTPERSASCHGSTVAFWLLHMCSAWPASRRPPTGASTVVVVALCLPEVQADAGHHNNCAGPCGCPYAVTSDGWLARPLDTWGGGAREQCSVTSAGQTAVGHAYGPAQAVVVSLTDSPPGLSRTPQQLCWPVCVVSCCHQWWVSARPYFNTGVRVRHRA